MKIFHLIILCFLLCGCSYAVENQQQNNTPVITLLLLPLQWTGTTTPTSTRTPTVPFTETDTPTMTETDTPLKDALRYSETAVTPHFSYIPPKGWQKVINPSGSKSATSWRTYDYKCSLRFMMFSASMTAKEFLISQMNEAKPINIFSEGSFPNAAALDTYRMVIQFDAKGPIDIYYVFHKDYYLLNGIYAPETDNCKSNDALIDKTMYSLQFEA